MKSHGVSPMSSESLIVVELIVVEQASRADDARIVA